MSRGKQFAVDAIDDVFNVKVRRKAFRDMAPIPCLSSAESWPANGGNAYKKAQLSLTNPRDTKAYGCRN